MSTRIVSLTAAPHPQARIDSVDAANGVCVFAWLDESGDPVDTGNSLARFTPAAVPDTDPVEYAEPDDETLAEAIANPPVEPTVLSQSVRVILARLTADETAAIFGSTDPQVITIRSMALAVGHIESNDSDATAGFGYLVAQGFLAANRPAELLAP